MVLPPGTVVVVFFSVGGVVGRVEAFGVSDAFFGELTLFVLLSPLNLLAYGAGKGGGVLLLVVTEMFGLALSGGFGFLVGLSGASVTSGEVTPLPSFLSWDDEDGVLAGGSATGVSSGDIRSISVYPLIPLLPAWTELPFDGDVLVFTPGKGASFVSSSLLSVSVVSPLGFNIPSNASPKDPRSMLPSSSSIELTDSKLESLWMRSPGRIGSEMSIASGFFLGAGLGDLSFSLSLPMKVLNFLEKEGDFFDLEPLMGILA